MGGKWLLKNTILSVHGRIVQLYVSTAEFFHFCSHWRDLSWQAQLQAEIIDILALSLQWQLSEMKNLLSLSWFKKGIT